MAVCAPVMYLVSYGMYLEYCDNLDVSINGDFIVTLQESVYTSLYTDSKPVSVVLYES